MDKQDAIIRLMAYGVESDIRHNWYMMHWARRQGAGYERFAVSHKEALMTLLKVRSLAKKSLKYLTF